MSLFSSLSFLIEATVEVVGVVLWFGFQRMDSIDSTLVGATILLVFLVVEHIVAQAAYTSSGVSAREGGRLFVFSLLEVINWVVWLSLIDMSQVLVAGVFFFVLLYVEHQLAYNTKKTREGVGFLSFSNRHLTSPGSRRLLFVGLVAFTITEVVGAGLWVGLVDGGRQIEGLAALIVGALIEHFLAGRVAYIR